MALFDGRSDENIKAALDEIYDDINETLKIINHSKKHKNISKEEYNEQDGTIKDLSFNNNILLQKRKTKHGKRQVNKHQLERDKRKTQISSDKLTHYLSDNFNVDVSHGIINGEYIEERDENEIQNDKCNCNDLGAYIYMGH